MMARFHALFILTLLSAGWLTCAHYLLGQDIIPRPDGNPALLSSDTILYNHDYNPGASSPTEPRSSIRRLRNQNASPASLNGFWGWGAGEHGGPGIPPSSSSRPAAGSSLHNDYLHSNSSSIQPELDGGGLSDGLPHGSNLAGGRYSVRGDTPWMNTAASQLGVTEVGNNSGAQVSVYQATTNNRSGDPWCSSFVNWTLEQNGIQGTGSGSSQSWRNWGEDAGGPVSGAVVVFSNGDGTGHVGFVDSVNADGTINVLGGNQSNKVSVRTFNTDKVVAYRVPRGFSAGSINYTGNHGSGSGLENTR